jgi:hypothetical protein
MTEASGGWARGGIFRIGPDGELPAFSVTRLPPELAAQQARPPAPAPLPAEPGFGGGPGEPDFAAGSVTGYRWWATAGDGVLLGMHAPWTAGENTACCLAPGAGAIPGTWAGPGSGHSPAEVPAKGCGCGFYAFWTVRPPYAMGSLLPVLGVIEGYGRTRTGTRGFRCAKARILALCPSWDEPDAVRAVVMAYPGARVYRQPGAMLAEFPPDPGYS